MALLPADAPNLLPGVREALDVSLHATLTKAGLALLPADRTERFIKDAVAAGLDCSLDSDDCALRASAAAGADAVIVARAVRYGSHLVVTLRLLSLDAQPRSVAGNYDDETTAAALAQRLMNPDAPSPVLMPVAVDVVPDSADIAVDGVDSVRDAGALWLTPGVHAVQVRAAGYASTSLSVDVPTTHLLPVQRVELARAQPPLMMAGVVLATSGGVLAGAAAVGVGLTEMLLAQPLEIDVRGAAQTTGRVLVGAAVVGVIAVAGGAALALVEGNDA